MTIQKLQRVMWRLRTKHPNTKTITQLQLQRAIMIECGTDPITYKHNSLALRKLGWLKVKKSRFILTGTDITEEF